MGLKVVTSFATLMILARELGNATLSGDENRIRKAQYEHDKYKQLCLESDEMSLHCTTNYLDTKRN